MGDDVLQDNVRQFLLNALSQPEPQQFDRLVDWVLPSATHSGFRLTGEYTSDRSLWTQTQAMAPVRRGGGGQLVSPALHLIELAKSLKRLEELKSRVEACRTSDEVSTRSRIALLTLIEIELGRFPEAEQWLSDLEKRIHRQTFPHLRDRWSETLALTVAVQHAELREIAESMLIQILEAQIRPGHHSGPLVWDRQMAALLGTLGRKAGKNKTSQESREWIEVAGCDEATRAIGLPALQWQRTDDQYQKLIGHQNDYLWFRSPLQGDFTIECDTSCFGFRELQLMIGGDWYSPHYALELMESGTLRGTDSWQKLAPKLSLVTDWTRQRGVVRDGKSESYFNGRLMQTRVQRPHQFPWIGFRSPFFANGIVRDVRLSGTPEIPDRVSLSSDPKLSGWVRFHLDEIGGSLPDWDYLPRKDSPGEIVGFQKTRIRGAYQESLLRYVRPMAEDGLIEYEFLYQENTQMVHPALDQLVFLIEPQGVSLHQSTCGIHDRSGLDPLNRQPMSPAVACPLHTGWNRLKLQVSGDTVGIDLNGTAVYSGPIPRDNDRSIGLFHYADQTEVRVRNLTWTGDWPKVLPSGSEQELWSHQRDELESRVEKLTDRIAFDFRDEPRPDKLQETENYSEKGFQFQSSDRKGTVSLKPTGLEMARPGVAEFHDVWVTPRIRIQGDFEVEAEFADLQLGIPSNGTNALYLIVVTEDEQTTHSRVWHGVYAHPGIDLRYATQAEFNRFGKNGGVSVDFQGATSQQCTSGRMRVVRLGKQMSFMIAEHDSSFFRVIHQADVTDAPVRFDGIRLGAGTWGSAEARENPVQVVWKSLSIRTQPGGATRLSP